MQNTEITGLVPPQAIELENAVLGAILIDKNAYFEVSNILTPESFYNPKNELIYKTIQELYKAGRQADIYIVSERLKDKVEPIEIVELTECVGTANQIVLHSQIVRQKYIERCIISMSTELRKIGFDNEQDVADKVAKVNRLCTRLTGLTDNQAENVKMDDICKKTLKQIEQNMERYENGLTSGVDTGITQLTQILGGGFGNGEVTILGGRPAMGKTALLIHLAKRAALTGVPVQVYSLEMNDVELGSRMIVAGGGVDSYDIRTGNLNKSQWQNIDVTVGELEKLPFWVNDKVTMTMDNIRINATLKHRKDECGIIFIDYLQLIKTPKGRNRNDEIGEISRQAKELAKELNVPVVLLSQLSRDVAKEADKTPKLIHLRDSGEIEQNADNVLLIHRPAYYNEPSFELDGTIVDTTGLGLLIVAKNRAGSPGVIPFSHNESLTQITDYQPIKF